MVVPAKSSDRNDYCAREVPAYAGSLNVFADRQQAITKKGELET